MKVKKYLRNENLKRTTYRNGDPISLGNCDGCQVLSINGHLVHEINCPDAWRDESLECFECGTHFIRSERGQTICDDCLNQDIYLDDEDQLTSNPPQFAAGWFYFAFALNCTNQGVVQTNKPSTKQENKI